MDDRFYLAVYDEERILPDRDRYVCDVTIPCYEFCRAGDFKGIRRSRFSEVAGKLYQLDEQIISRLDEELAPELVRHQAMAADEERLYNVYLYVAEEP